MNPKPQFDYHLLLASQRISVIASRLLLVVMVTCLIIPLVIVGEQLLPNWSGEYLILVVSIVLLESFYLHYRLRKVRISEARWWIARGAQLIVIFLLGKFAIYLSTGYSQFLADIQLWKSDFFGAFFNIPALVTFLIAFLVWSFGGEIDNLLYEIEGDERIFLDDMDAGYSEQRSQARQRLSNMVIVLGGLMVITFGILSLGSSSIVQAESMIEFGIYALLIYFLCALILLGLSQFAILRVRWIINRVEVDRKVVTHWIGLGLGLTIILAFLASLLPTEYSGQLLRVVQILSFYILNFLFFVTSLVMTPFILFFGWLLSLFRGEEVNIKPPRRIEMPVELLSSQSAVPDWLELLKSILFWSLFMGLLVYALVYYFKEHPDYFRWMKDSKWFSWIREFWMNLRYNLFSIPLGVSQIIRDQVDRLKPKVSGDSGQRRATFFNPRRFDARQQVIFYYLALIKKGEQKGIWRGPAQTPNEYSEKLSRGLESYNLKQESIKKSSPGIQTNDLEILKENLASLTEGFVEARYSKHEITFDRASVLRMYWENILHWLRISRIR